MIMNVTIYLSVQLEVWNFLKCNYIASHFSFGAYAIRRNLRPIRNISFGDAPYIALCAVNEASDGVWGVVTYVHA